MRRYAVWVCSVRCDGGAAGVLGVVVIMMAIGWWYDHLTEGYVNDVAVRRKRRIFL